ncbi:hypothetical protein GX408_07910 [bacterium]|nr:hypothetical protein [bacterium]
MKSLKARILPHLALYFTKIGCPDLIALCALLFIDRVGIVTVGILLCVDKAGCFFIFIQVLKTGIYLIVCFLDELGCVIFHKISVIVCMCLKINAFDGNQFAAEQIIFYKAG